MSTAIQLTIGGHSLDGELNDSETGRALAQRLPLTVRMSRWGDEYYGDIGTPLGVGQAPEARDEMSVGELAYWLPGNALCLFFGPTPVSRGNEPRAASEVNPAGRVSGDFDALKELGASEVMLIAAAT